MMSLVSLSPNSVCGMAFRAMQDWFTITSHSLRERYDSVKCCGHCTAALRAACWYCGSIVCCVLVLWQHCVLRPGTVAALRAASWYCGSIACCVLVLWQHCVLRPGTVAALRAASWYCGSIVCCVLELRKCMCSMIGALFCCCYPVCAVNLQPCMLVRLIWLSDDRYISRASWLA